MLDARLHDEDVDAPNFIANPFDADDTATEAAAAQLSLRSPNDFRARAAEVYYLYTMRYHAKFKWIRTNLFADALSDDLASDADRLIEVLQSYGDWDAAADEKLNALENLLTQTHPDEKVLVSLNLPIPSAISRRNYRRGACPVLRRRPATRQTPPRWRTDSVLSVTIGAPE